MKSQTLVIIPAYNEEKFLTSVLQRVRSEGFSHIVVVNDGSKDKTEKIAQHFGATVLSHVLNRGAGAATRTGIDWGLCHDFKFFLTLDADDQHDPTDFFRFLEALKDHDFVLGSRFLQKNNFPVLKLLANKMANFLTGFFFHVWVSDSQSGIRGFSRKVAEQVHGLSDGFEFCSDFLREVQENGFSIFEVPVSVSYSPYSKGKGQNFSHGLKTGLKIFLRSISGNKFL